MDILLKPDIDHKRLITNEVCIHGLLYDARFSKKDKMNFLDSATIIVEEMNNSQPKTIYYTNKAGAFFFKLPLNKLFQITLKKDGWLSKKLKLNTQLNEKEIRQFHLFIDAELYRKNTIHNLNEDDLPVMEIHYDESEMRFLTDDTEAIKFYKKIRKLHHKK